MPAGRSRGHRLAVPGEILPPSGQGPIPDEAASPGQPEQALFLSLGRPHSESVNLVQDGHGSDSLLVFDVLLDHGQRRAANGGNEIGVRPERRKPTSQSRKLLPQKPRRPPLDEFDEAVDAKPRINLNQQMNVVGHDLHLDQPGPSLRDDLSRDLLKPRIDALDQHGPPKLGAENDVVLARVDDVPIALVLHASIIQRRRIESTPVEEIALYPHA